MKLLSSLFIQIVIVVVTTMMITNVEGQVRAKVKPTPMPSQTPPPTMPNKPSTPRGAKSGKQAPTPSPTPPAAAGKASKASRSSKSSKAADDYYYNYSSFDTCSLANPPFEQAKLVPGPSSLTMDQFLKNDLLGKGGVGYLALHATGVYSTFANWVEEWVKKPNDQTKDSIHKAGETTGKLHTSLSLSATDQCNMMKALVGQMKKSCHQSGMDAYVKVASAYMTGFNSAAGDEEKKQDFVTYCGGFGKIERLLLAGQNQEALEEIPVMNQVY